MFTPEERFFEAHAGPLALLLVGQHGWLDGPLLETIARSPYRDDVLVVRDAEERGIDVDEAIMSAARA